MRVDEGVRQGFGAASSLVRAGVVHDDHLVHHLLGHDLLVRPAQRLGGVARGHDHDDFLIFEHGPVYNLRFTIYDFRRRTGAAGIINRK